MPSPKSPLFLQVMLYVSLPVFLLGQSIISGRVLDQQNSPLAFANVLLLKAADSSLVKGAISADDGTFEVESPESGRFFLRITLLGYTDLNTQAFDGGARNIGKLMMEATSTQLETVEVKARRPFLEQKTDRLVVNVANSISLSAGTALEVLQRSPGVRVNRQTQSIALSGKQGVVVMINGKISRIPDDALVQMLEGISASSIERIEIIHTPPANYEAEGNAGIIHIVLKTNNQQGINGSYALNAGYGKRGKWGGNGNINYRDSRINIFGRYDANANINPQTFGNYRSVRQGQSVLETDMESHRPGLRSTVQNARLGADWQVSKKTTIGILGTFFDRNRLIDATNSVTQRSNGIPTNTLHIPNQETNHYGSFTANINLAHQIAPQHSFSIDADFVAFDINRPSYYSNLYIDAAGQVLKEKQLRISMQTPIRVGVIKADFERPLGKNAKLEAGSKISVMGFDNDTRVELLEAPANWSIVPNLSSTSRFDETIAGMYVSLSASAIQNTDIKIGLRYEHTRTKLGSAGQTDIVNRQYGSWFPSVFVARKLDDAQSLNFSYSRRIRRPQFSWLAPWINFSDPSTFQKGNPALLPAITGALKLTWSRKGLQVSLLHSVENQALRAVSLVDARQDIQYNTYENLDKFYSSGVELAFRLAPAPWWEMQNNASLFHQTTAFQLESERFRLRNAAFAFNSTQTFTLPRQYVLELSGDYDSPRYWGIARWRATGSLNIGIQKNLGAGWGKFRLNVTDILQTANWYGRTEQPEANLLVETAFRAAERTIMLTWNKDFGSKSIKSARKRQTGAAEEVQRL